MDAPFVTTGFVTPQPKGPLYITAVTATDLIVIGINYGSLPILERLQRGEQFENVVASLQALQKHEVVITFSKLQAIKWIEGETELQLMYENDRGRICRTPTLVATKTDREALLEVLQERVGHRFRQYEQPASFWRMAWSQMLGALVSALGTVFIYAIWDPQVIPGNGAGAIALFLGREGCFVVGCGFVVACLIAAWWRVRHRPIEYRWIVWTV